MYPPGTPGPFRIANHGSGLCLDTGSFGSSVYVGRCNGDDAGQRWGWWNGGWLINLQLDQCLAAVTISGAVQARLQPCVDYPFQHWTHQNFAILNTSTGTNRCLQPAAAVEGANVAPVTCRTTSSQGWSVTYW
ncbi:unnamed protein product [[Actinomadura] parvosata subsp. kistnae]|uniref:Ricin B lectin domain-containing protein n=1 Tax=[Actinomadura] parvosata subsp. kistnae TaxID=1909395 RepID=A0A1U9ZW98_9ACTN|nr:ricin-type beta-trefoil lectin domain protein [Nonomuraea sp. ATCC 55076]AQZ62212.1 hypothetical protein BKM31_12700 [Nonomuraea sp. ATCC 55076]SPL95979.1 unnamed protein product [Actinomadura parvosata subsp. kistnae]